MGNQGHTTMSLHFNVRDSVVNVKKNLKLNSNSEAVQVLLAAYDIINGTGHGGEFTEAVKKALEEKR